MSAPLAWNRANVRPLVLDEGLLCATRQGIFAVAPDRGELRVHAKRGYDLARDRDAVWCVLWGDLVALDAKTLLPRARHPSRLRSARCSVGGAGLALWDDASCAVLSRDGREQLSVGPEHHPSAVTLSTSSASPSRYRRAPARAPW